ncbi:MAG: hypothetical protein JST43_07590 [Bacteroidetes bacterium]|nr:hypothetical protein [Bacteroidota bacterium]MBS1540910.1 hypothetical protein [Bacteroidota bacterium]
MLFSSFSLKNLLSLRELEQEKAKDYRNIVILQVVIITFGLTLTQPILEDSKSELSKFIITVFSFFGVLYTYLLCDLLRNLTRSKLLLITIYSLLIGSVGLGLLAEFPYYQVILISNRQALLLFVHGLLFPIEVIVIVHAMRDIFTGSHLTSDKLWGAACVFLMVGISFGSLYDILTIIKQGGLGKTIELGFPNYSECINFSFCILGGVDHGLEPEKLIRNISTLEGVFGSLYGMLIIGKLLGLPRTEEKITNS